MANGGRSKTAFFIVVFFSVLTVVSIYGFTRPWRSEVATQEGSGIDGVITYLLVATGVLVVVGHFVLVRFIWRSSSGNSSGYRRPSGKVEWTWGIIPVILMILIAEGGVLGLASPVWSKLYIEEAQDPLVLEVVGKQFEWFIRFPGKDGVFGDYDFDEVDGVDNPLGLIDDPETNPAAQDDIVKRGTLYLPVGREVVIRLRTHDVIHSFFVPQFRLKQDLIPGFPTRVKFTPTKIGDYELACAELCGLGHYRMRGTVHVREPIEFEEWLSRQMPFGG
ncbi:MAG: cytochrome c oxidase subunit II [Planctomycetota bacterium]|jgi:cytochrome c oxidase subunit 2